MVRTVNARHEDGEGTPESSSHSVRGDERPNAFRSKHSETEQRRRSKINERFQMLRDLIPENDQKRDKASFLLEVIQYIQFLQERIRMYEGMNQGWDQEPTKLTPWRGNSGPVESFVNQSQLATNGTAHEENFVVNQTLLSGAPNQLESDLRGAAPFKTTDGHMTVNQAIPLDTPLQSNLFDGVSGQNTPGSFLDVEALEPQSQSQSWSGRSCGNECSVPLYTLNEEEEMRSESEEASISTSYSQGLLKSLNNVLQQSGVDLSQTNISVQLDVGRCSSGGSAPTTSIMKEQGNRSGVDSVSCGNIDEDYNHPHKKLRTDRT